MFDPHEGYIGSLWLVNHTFPHLTTSRMGDFHRWTVFSCLFPVDWPTLYFPASFTGILFKRCCKISCRVAARIWSVVYFHSFDYSAFIVRLFCTVPLLQINSAADPRGAGLPFIMILNWGPKGQGIYFRDCLPPYLRDKMSIRPHHISRTCNYILQGKMWPELPLYSVSLVK